MGYRDYSTAKGHIVDATGHGDFTDVQAAVNAAVSGQTIFIRPGTYTLTGGVLTLKDGVDIFSFTEESVTPNVTLVGKVLLSTGGTVTIGGFRIQNDGDYCVQLTGALSSLLQCKSIFLTQDNFDGINCTNSSGAINFDSCFFEPQIGGLRFVVATGGTIDFLFCQHGNVPPLVPAVSTTNNATVVFFYCTNGAPFSSTGTGGVSYFYTYTDVGDLTAYVSNALGNHNIYYSSFLTGNQISLSIGAGSAVNCLHSLFGTNNVTAIDGAGAIGYADLTFPGGNAITTATQTPFPWKPFATAGTTVTGVRGTSAFDSTQFTVTDGFVQLSGGAGTNWTDMSGAFGATSNNGYFLTAASTPTLPAAPGQGAIVQFVCDTGATVTVTANAGQRIEVGTVLSAVAGTAVSNTQGNALTLIFRNATSTWHAIDAPQGTWVVT